MARGKEGSSVADGDATLGDETRRSAADTLFRLVPILAAVAFVAIVAAGSECDLLNVIVSIIQGLPGSLVAESALVYVGSSHYALCTWMLLGLALTVAAMATIRPSLGRMRYEVEDLLTGDGAQGSDFTHTYELWLSNKSLFHAVDIYRVGRKVHSRYVFAGGVDRDASRGGDGSASSPTFFKRTVWVREGSMPFVASIPVRVAYVLLWAIGAFCVVLLGMNALSSVGVLGRIIDGLLVFAVAVPSLFYFWRAFALVLMLRNLSFERERLRRVRYLKARPEETRFYRRLSGVAIRAEMYFLVSAFLITCVLIVWMLLACQPVVQVASGVVSAVTVAEVDTLIVPRDVCNVYQSINIVCAIVLPFGMMSALVIAGGTHLYLRRIVGVWRDEAYSELVEDSTDGDYAAEEPKASHLREGAGSLGLCQSREEGRDPLELLREERADDAGRRSEAVSVAMGILTIAVQVIAAVVQATR